MFKLGKSKTPKQMLTRMMIIFILGSLAIFSGFTNMVAGQFTQSRMQDRPDYCELGAGPCPKKLIKIFAKLSKEQVELPIEGEDISLKGWYLPSVTGSAILMLHDYRSNKESLLGLAAHFNQLGMGVLLLDQLGHGQSPGDEIHLDVSDDRYVQSAFEYLAQQAEVDSSQTIVLGEGWGAGKALALKQSIPTIPIVIAVNPTLQISDQWTEARTQWPWPFYKWVHWRLVQKQQNRYDKPFQEIQPQKLPGHYWVLLSRDASNASLLDWLTLNHSDIEVMFLPEINSEDEVIFWEKTARKTMEILENGSI